MSKKSLIKKLNDEHHNVRKNAALALGKLGNKDDLKNLKKLLNDTNPDVVRAASKLLNGEKIKIKTKPNIFRDSFLIEEKIDIKISKEIIKIYIFKYNQLSKHDQSKKIDIESSKSFIKNH